MKGFECIKSNSSNFGEGGKKHWSQFAKLSHLSARDYCRQCCLHAFFRDDFISCLLSAHIHVVCTEFSIHEQVGEKLMQITGVKLITVFSLHSSINDALQ